MIGKRLSAAHDICLRWDAFERSAQLRCRQRLLLALLGLASVDRQCMLLGAKRVSRISCPKRRDYLGRRMRSGAPRPETDLTDRVTLNSRHRRAASATARGAPAPNL